MLKYHTLETSCRAIPSEVSLIFNISGCTIKCPGCCERALWKDKGTVLTFNEVRAILNNYSCAISCVCFMGGEHEPAEINSLARFVKLNYPSLRTAWYSGLNKIPEEIEYRNFDYLKTGPYEASKGPLGTAGTNQRVFQVAEDCSLSDITDKYIRTEPDEVRQVPVETPEAEDIPDAEEDAETPAVKTEEESVNIEEAITIEEAEDIEETVTSNDGFIMEI